ncbi:unnamed protein product [Porites lobata]|uniref:Uncharacterized protein n=1 Tax=Porites lobata TaxID=104759 RepID=A0ABN8MQ99_9CNID|nr:unnamed protein product [Porites lobata]
MADVNRRASLLACYLLILSILRRRRARRIPRRHRFWELGAYHTLSTLFALSASSPFSIIFAFIATLHPRPSRISLLLLSRYSFL